MVSTKDVAHSRDTHNVAKSIFIRYIELVRTFSRSRKIHISLFVSLLFVDFCLSFMEKKALKSHKIPECWFGFCWIYLFLLLLFSSFFDALLFLFNEIVSLISGDLCVLVGGCVIKITNETNSNRERLVLKATLSSLTKSVYNENANNTPFIWMCVFLSLSLCAYWMLCSYVVIMDHDQMMKREKEAATAAAAKKSSTHITTKEILFSVYNKTCICLRWFFQLNRLSFHSAFS